MGNPLELGNQQSQGWQRLRDHVMFAKKNADLDAACNLLQDSTECQFDVVEFAGFLLAESAVR